MTVLTSSHNSKKHTHSPIMLSLLARVTLSNSHRTTGRSLSTARNKLSSEAEYDTVSRAPMEEEEAGATTGKAGAVTKHMMHANAHRRARLEEPRGANAGPPPRGGAIQQEKSTDPPVRALLQLIDLILGKEQEKCWEQEK